MKLYHISTSLMHTGIFTPQVPSGIEEGDSEDWITPRICFSDSIEGCLTGIPDGGIGLPAYIRSKSGKAYFKLFTLDTDAYKGIILSPEVIANKVPDALQTREYWIMDGLKLEGVLIRLEEFSMAKSGSVENVKYISEQLGDGQAISFNFIDKVQMTKFVDSLSSYPVKIKSTGDHEITLTALQAFNAREIFLLHARNRGEIVICQS